MKSSPKTQVWVCLLLFCGVKDLVGLSGFFSLDDRAGGRVQGALPWDWLEKPRKEERRRQGSQEAVPGDHVVSVVSWEEEAPFNSSHSGATSE